MKIDFTTTAMPRPDIVQRTYESFSHKIIGLPFNLNDLYINIDPFPYNSDKEFQAIDQKRQEVIRVAKKIFKNVYFRCPEHANYTKAYDWLWSSAQSDIIFNLEDDWELTRAINIFDLLKFFDQVPTLYEVVLRAYTYEYPCTCTSPGLLHARYYKKIGGKMNPHRNPETQTHSTRSKFRFGIKIPNRKNCRNPKKYVVAYPEFNQKVVVNDIGRAWLDRSPYMRPQMLSDDDPRFLKKDLFISWIKKDSKYIYRGDTI